MRFGEKPDSIAITGLQKQEKMKTPKQVEMEKQEERKILAIAGFGTFILTFPWAYFLAKTTLVWNELFEFNFNILPDKILTIDFLLFAILSTLPIAFCLALTRKIERKKLITAAVGGSLLGLSVANLIFPALLSFWMIWVFYLAAIAFGLEIADLRKEELHAWVNLRAFSAGLKKSINVLAIGILVAGILFIAPQYGEFKKDFNDSIEKGLNIGDMAKELREAEAALAVESQKSLMDNLVNSAQFQFLRDKDDRDVQNFILLMEKTKVTIDSPSYKNEIINAMQSDSESGSGIKITEMIKDRVPVYGLIENALIVLHPLMLVSFFVLISGIVIRPIGTIIALIMGKLLEGL